MKERLKLMVKYGIWSLYTHVYYLYTPIKNKGDELLKHMVKNWKNMCHIHDKVQKSFKVDKRHTQALKLLLEHLDSRVQHFLKTQWHNNTNKLLRDD